MALPKIGEIRDLDDKDLAAEVLAAKKKLFDLRFDTGYYDDIIG